MNFLKYHDYLRGRGVLEAAPPPQLLAPPNCDPRTYIGYDDEHWTASWLSQQQLTPIIPKATPTKNQIPPNQAKLSLKASLLILEKLNELQTELATNVDTITTSDWKQKTVEIGLLKDEFTKLMAKFDNVESVKALKGALERRKRKRARQKRQRLNRGANITRKVERNRKMHAEIDQWLSNKRDQSEKTRAEQTLKKDADIVLAEVTKKKGEARKQLSLIRALIKLRTVREQFAEQRGEVTSAEDRHAFNVTTAQLVTIWENCLNSCAIEEQALRSKLEQTAEDDSKAARLGEERKLLDEWNTVLFGPKVHIASSNAIYWALTAAERDLETFIAMRKSWDTFLVPPGGGAIAGSSIPIGWALPNKQAKDFWTQYLHP